MRLGISLDLDIRNSDFSKFMKKIKVTNREKANVSTKPYQNGSIPNSMI